MQGCLVHCASAGSRRGAAWDGIRKTLPNALVIPQRPNSPLLPPPFLRVSGRGRPAAGRRRGPKAARDPGGRPPGAAAHAPPWSFSAPHQTKYISINLSPLPHPVPSPPPPRSPTPSLDTPHQSPPPAGASAALAPAPTPPRHTLPLTHSRRQAGAEDPPFAAPPRRRRRGRLAVRAPQTAPELKRQAGRKTPRLPHPRAEDGAGDLRYGPRRRGPNQSGRRRRRPSKAGGKPGGRPPVCRTPAAKRRGRLAERASPE